MKNWTMGQTVWVVQEYRVEERCPSCLRLEQEARSLIHEQLLGFRNHASVDVALRCDRCRGNEAGNVEVMRYQMYEGTVNAVIDGYNYRDVRVWASRATHRADIREECVFETQEEAQAYWERMTGDDQ